MMDTKNWIKAEVKIKSPISRTTTMSIKVSAGLKKWIEAHNYSAGLIVTDACAWAGFKEAE